MVEIVGEFFSFHVNILLISRTKLRVLHSRELKDTASGKLRNENASITKRFEYKLAKSERTVDTPNDLLYH